MGEGPLPPLRRDLDLVPVQHQGQQYIVVQDALGLVPQGKALNLGLYHLISLMDGSRTVRDIQAQLMRHSGGLLVDSDQVMQVVNHLDEAFLLDSQRFQSARDSLVRTFSSQPVRPPSHAGLAYPLEQTALEERLNQILNGHGPAAPPASGSMEALVSPHIDLTVGSKGYARAYATLSEAELETVIILGIGHRLQHGLFCLTQKDFETPLGLARCDREAVGRLEHAAPGILTGDDFAHRSEHSIEFQVLFLQHLFRERPVSILPILCGSLQAGLVRYSREAYQEQAGPFLHELSQICADPHTLVIAGVDFSHTGPKFGHQVPATRLQNRFEQHDRNLLTHLCARDPDRFWEESSSVQDQYHVCGFAALACLLEILPPAQGQLLHYEIWHEPPTQSAVSFASVAFTR